LDRECRESLLAHPDIPSASNQRNLLGEGPLDRPLRHLVGFAVKFAAFASYDLGLPRREGRPVCTPAINISVAYQ